MNILFENLNTMGEKMVAIKKNLGPFHSFLYELPKHLRNGCFCPKRHPHALDEDQFSFYKCIQVISGHISYHFLFTFPPICFDDYEV